MRKQFSDEYKEYQKEKRLIVKEIQENSKGWDLKYKKAWGHLIEAYKLVGWKDLFYLILKFQPFMKSNYKLKDGTKNS